jgi:hypothetical protein
MYNVALHEALSKGENSYDSCCSFSDIRSEDAREVAGEREGEREGKTSSRRLGGAV